MPTKTIQTSAGTFEISSIPSNSHYFVRHLETGAHDVYTSGGLNGTFSFIWPFGRVREIANAVRAMSSPRLERRRRVVNAA